MRTNIKFAASMCLVGIVSFSLWPLWKWFSIKPVDPITLERTRTIVTVHPELKPAWNIAMQDGVLTWDEAKEIVEGAGEKMDAEK